ncbi:MAG: hypothetical protein ACR5KV_05520 [Wolbachia sp.]
MNAVIIVILVVDVVSMQSQIYVKKVMLRIALGNRFSSRIKKSNV